MTTSLPKVTPLVLKRRADNDAWIFELKYDGFRALLEIDGEARLVSPNRDPFRHLDLLAAALAKRLRVSDAVLDGEVICVDETGRPIFLDLLRRKESVSSPSTCYGSMARISESGEQVDSQNRTRPTARSQAAARELQKLERSESADEIDCYNTLARARQILASPIAPPNDDHYARERHQQ